MRMTTTAEASLIGAFTVAVALMTTVTAAREDVILAAAYGTGVHAYSSGDYQRSYDELSSAIEGGSQDPRAFYFRGLAALKLGRLDEAEADFISGANAETAGRGNWPVARSLERIQGEPRLLLEKYRVRARMAALQHRREAIVRHYSQAETINPDVQRTRRPERLPGMPTPVQESIPAPAVTEPAVTPEPPMAEEDDEAPTDKPATPPKPMADDPFGDEGSGGAAKPKPSDDPFGDAGF
jgi:hypothetical protein